jgi:hypothetical protein
LLLFLFLFLFFVLSGVVGVVLVEDEVEVLLDDVEVLDDELVEDELVAVPTTIDTDDPLARLAPPGGACVTTRPTFAASLTGRKLTCATSPAPEIAACA